MTNLISLLNKRKGNFQKMLFNVIISPNMPFRWLQEVYLMAVKHPPVMTQNQNKHQVISSHSADRVQVEDDFMVQNQFLYNDPWFPLKYLKTACRSVLKGLRENRYLQDTHLTHPWRDFCEDIPWAEWGGQPWSLALDQNRIQEFSKKMYSSRLGSWATLSQINLCYTSNSTVQSVTEAILINTGFPGNI